MRSFLYPLQVRFLASIPVACLFWLLFVEDSTDTSSVAQTEVILTSSSKIMSRSVVTISDSNRDSEHDEIREDARWELERIRQEIAMIDSQSDGAFTRTLREVLQDPHQSVALVDCETKRVECESEACTFPSEAKQTRVHTPWLATGKGASQASSFGAACRAVHTLDCSCRLPVSRGMSDLFAILGQATNFQEEQEQWAFIAVAAVLTSSTSGEEVDNYLFLDQRRPVRNVLFED